MSVELLEDDIKKKFNQGGNSTSNAVHQHRSQQLLYPYVYVDSGKKDEFGEPILEQKVDVDARTEITAPSGMTLLDVYVPWYELTFPFRKGKSIIRNMGERHRINMISKNRKGRTEYTMIETASSLNSKNEDSDGDTLKKLQES